MKTISEIKEETAKIKEGWKKERKQHDWFGLVYCNEGWASIVGGDFKGIWLGKTADLIPYYKSRGFNGENVDIAIQLAKDHREESKNKALESPQVHLRGSRKGVGVKSCLLRGGVKPTRIKKGVK